MPEILTDEELADFDAEFKRYFLSWLDSHRQELVQQLALCIEHEGRDSDAHARIESLLWNIREIVYAAKLESEESIRRK